MKWFRFLLLTIVLFYLHPEVFSESPALPPSGEDATRDVLKNMDTLMLDELLALARAYSDSGQIQLSIYADKEILSRTHHEPMEEPRGDVFLRLGHSFYHLGEFDQSLQHLMKALDFYQHRGDSIYEARVLNNIANIYSQHGDYELALEYYFACLGIFQQVGHTRGISITYANIGYIKGQLGEHDAGLFYLEKSLDISESAGIKDIVGQLIIIGFNYREQGQLERAIEYYHRAWQTSRELGSHWNMVRSLNNLGSVYLEAGRYSLARARLIEAREYLEEYDFRELKKDNYFTSSLLYEKTDNPAQALEYYKKYETLKDDLFSKEKVKMISEIKTLHEIERREQEIKLLRAENEVYNQEIAARKARYRIVLTGGVLVTLLLGLLYFQSRQKTNAYRQLVLKNLEIVEKEKSAVSYTEPNGAPPLYEPLENMTGEEPENDDVASERYGSSSLSEAQKISLLLQIKNLFELNKVFKDPELSLDKLAGMLNTNNKYISQIINESFNKSFINYVNEYRIREARKLLADPDFSQYTIETVAEMVGFKSKSAFNRSFKKITGLTPSFFQKSSLESFHFSEVVHS
jgi:AraC-like DNA-binding protein